MGGFWYSRWATMAMFIHGWMVEQLEPIFYVSEGRSRIGVHSFEADTENWVLDPFLTEGILLPLHLCSATVCVCVNTCNDVCWRQFSTHFPPCPPTSALRMCEHTFIKIRHSHNCLIFVKRISILVKQCLHIRSAPWCICHYNNVIMSVMAFQITSLTIVCSNVYSATDQRKHQCSASLVFVRGIHRWPVNSPHKGPVTQKMFPFEDIIMWAASLVYVLHWNRNDNFRCSLQQNFIKMTFPFQCIIITAVLFAISCHISLGYNSSLFY